MAYHMYCSMPRFIRIGLHPCTPCRLPLHCLLRGPFSSKGRFPSASLRLNGALHESFTLNFRTGMFPWTPLSPCSADFPPQVQNDLHSQIPQIPCFPKIEGGPPAHAYNIFHYASASLLPLPTRPPLSSLQFYVHHF